MDAELVDFEQVEYRTEISKTAARLVGGDVAYLEGFSSFELQILDAEWLREMLALAVDDGTGEQGILSFKWVGNGVKIKLIDALKIDFVVQMRLFWIMNTKHSRSYSRKDQAWIKTLHGLLLHSSHQRYVGFYDGEEIEGINYLQFQNEFKNDERLPLIAQFHLEYLPNVVRHLSKYIELKYYSSENEKPNAQDLVWRALLAGASKMERDQSNMLAMASDQLVGWIPPDRKADQEGDQMRRFRVNYEVQMIKIMDQFNLKFMEHDFSTHAEKYFLSRRRDGSKPLDVGFGSTAILEIISMLSLVRGWSAIIVQIGKQDGVVPMALLSYLRSQIRLGEADSARKWLEQNPKLAVRMEELGRKISEKAKELAYQRLAERCGDDLSGLLPGEMKNVLARRVELVAMA